MKKALTKRVSLLKTFEEIRREILRKKKEREGLEEAEVELAMEADKARESESRKNEATEVNEPSGPTAHGRAVPRELEKSKRRQSD